jgi:predicted enzyme related to lactoylglutathione lyase
MAEATAPEMNAPKPGEFCWTEIRTDNLQTCRNFYHNVFGWELKQSQATGEDFEYLEYNVPGRPSMGGMFRMTAQMCGGAEPPPPHLMNYIHVDNVDDLAGRAFDLGAKIVAPPTDIPNVGRFAMIEDPAGARFAVINIKGGE